MIGFFRKWRKKKEEEREQEEVQRRSQLIEELKADTSIAMSLEKLREIKTRPPRESKYQDRHEFQHNVVIYNIQKHYIEGRLSEAGVKLEDIGISEKELDEIWMAAVRADIIVDAKEFGLTVTAGSKVLTDVTM